ncbi:MAG: DUF4157 domain-containing protein [Hyphomonadaceae bacterium]
MSARCPPAFQRVRLACRPAHAARARPLAVSASSRIVPGHIVPVCVLLAAASLLAYRPAHAQPEETHPTLASITGHEFATGVIRGVMSQQANTGGSLLSRTLASGLIRSRDAARSDARPIPADIRKALEPYFPAEMLDTVRYSIGDTSPDGLAGFAMRNGNAVAVTLIDTIVFKSEDYVNSLSLWAHELHHVEQYQAWGVQGFAQRYTFGWNAVEAEARERARDFVEWRNSLAAK